MRDLREVATRIAIWFEGQAAREEAQAKKAGRFPSLQEQDRAARKASKP